MILSEHIWIAQLSCPKPLAGQRTVSQTAAGTFPSQGRAGGIGSICLSFILSLECPSIQHISTLKKGLTVCSWGAGGFHSVGQLLCAPSLLSAVFPPYSIWGSGLCSSGSSSGCTFPFSLCGPWKREGSGAIAVLPLVQKLLPADSFSGSLLFSGLQQ